MVLHVESRLPAYVVPDGMARSVFENKYSRRKEDGTLQSYEERVREMIYGNFLMDPRWQEEATETNQPKLWADYKRSVELAVAGIMPTSGRHLQHGDETQPDKIMELFTNCSTALFSFMSFRLLLRGSGVGRDYSAACCRVNWDNVPDIRLVLDETHPDFSKGNGQGWLEAKRDAMHKYDSNSENVRWFTVGDSREGWGKVVEILETAAFQEKHKNKLFIFDFSEVRPEGAPIMGLQGRPASGPLSFMKGIAKIYSLKNAGLKPWKQALFVDHYLAELVQWGGARRSARMSVKNWRDRDVIEFIDIKRGGFLWSSNNSILADQEFWEAARSPRHSHARRVFEAAVNAAYWDSTGEPGFINVDLCNNNKTGMELITGSDFIDTKTYTDLHAKTKEMASNVLEHVKQIKYPFLTNPCFSSDTLIVTDKGARPIQDLVGETVRIHDGAEWREIDNFRVTGRDQPILKITLHDGSSLRVTPAHTMVLEDGRKLSASELNTGHRLALHNVEYSGTTKLQGAYIKGFMLGDGYAGRNGPILKLYEPKFVCMDRLIASAAELPVGDINTSAIENLSFKDSNSKRQTLKVLQGLTVRKDDLLPWCGEYKYQLPPEIYTVNAKDKFDFIAGLFDSDGCATESGTSIGYQLASVHVDWLKDVQTLLKSIGVKSKLGKLREEALSSFPDNKIYVAKECWRLAVSTHSAIKLAKQVSFSRLISFADKNVIRKHVSNAGVVTDIVNDGTDDVVYCCTVPNSHTVTTAIGIITGQCGEIVLSTYGGYCVIGDVNLSPVTNMNDALDAVEMQAKFLVRVNRMNSEYSAEVRRTNRIGVSLTGIHEFAYKLFGLTFYDMIDYYTVLDDPEKAGAHKAHGFWKSVNLLRIAAEFAAAQISEELGMVTPHTVTTVKPSGTVSKVVNTTEGAHLPALAHYLRWVQFKQDDPDIKDLVARGYPLKDISHRYSGHIAIGFPTKQPIVDLMGDRVVTADDTTPEQNFIWLRLLEHHWLGAEHGRNNQISYTLKYDASKVSYEEFMAMILKWQPQVRCCSVMPQNDWKESEKIYGYVPEQPITAAEYVEMMAKIIPVEKEQYDDEQMACEGGICPIEPDINR